MVCYNFEAVRLSAVETYFISRLVEVLDCARTDIFYYKKILTCTKRSNGWPDHAEGVGTCLLAGRHPKPTCEFQ